jgi:hypothetical protein
MYANYISFRMLILKMSLPCQLPARMIDGFNNNVQLPFNVTASFFFNYRGLGILACSISEFNYEIVNLSDTWKDTLNNGYVPRKKIRRNTEYKTRGILTVSREIRTLRAKYLNHPKPYCTYFSIILCERQLYLLLRRRNCLYSFIISYVVTTTCFGLIGHLQECSILTFTLLFLLALPTLAIVYTMGAFVQVFKFLCLCNVSFIQRRIVTCRSDL